MSYSNVRFRTVEVSSPRVIALCEKLSRAFDRRIRACPLTDALCAIEGASEIISVPGLNIFVAPKAPFSTDFADTHNLGRNDLLFVRSPFSLGFAESVGSVHLAELEADVVGANAFNRVAGSIRVTDRLTLGEIFNSLQ